MSPSLYLVLFPRCDSIATGFIISSTQHIISSCMGRQPQLFLYSASSLYFPGVATECCTQHWLLRRYGSANRPWWLFPPTATTTTTTATTATAVTSLSRGRTGTLQYKDSLLTLIHKTVETPDLAWSGCCHSNGGFSRCLCVSAVGGIRCPLSCFACHTLCFPL